MSHAFLMSFNNELEVQSSYILSQALVFT